MSCSASVPSRCRCSNGRWTRTPPRTGVSRPRRYSLNSVADPCWTTGPPSGPGAAASPVRAYGPGAAIDGHRITLQAHRAGRLDRRFAGRADRRRPGRLDVQIRAGAHVQLARGLERQVPVARISSASPFSAVIKPAWTAATQIVESFVYTSVPHSTPAFSAPPAGHPSGTGCVKSIGIAFRTVRQLICPGAASRANVYERSQRP